MASHLPLRTFSVISWRAQGGTRTTDADSDRRERLARQARRRNHGPGQNMRIDEDPGHAPHAASSSSLMGSRKSGMVSCATTPSRSPRRMPRRFAGTSWTTGTPPRAMMTSSPRSAAARSSESFAFALGHVYLHHGLHKYGPTPRPWSHRDQGMDGHRINTSST